jgi:hypothetical protein
LPAPPGLPFPSPSSGTDAEFIVGAFMLGVAGVALVATLPMYHDFEDYQNLYKKQKE